MPYSVKADILKQISNDELAQLSSDSGTVVDDAVVDKAIADADSVIDSYVAKRLSVPLTAPVPARVNQLSVTIALYHLFSRRSNRTGMDDTILKNYDDAIRFLELVAKGQVTVGIDPPPAASTDQKAEFNSNDRRFTEDSMKGY